MARQRRKYQDQTIVGTEDTDLIKTASGNDTIMALSGDDFVFTDRGNDEIDAGAGSDIVFAGAGNDVVIHNASENAGDYNIYSGGFGSDTLRLVIPSEVLASEAFQQDLAAFESQVASKGSASLYFSSLNLQVFSFENIEVVVEQEPPTVTTENPQSVVEGDYGVSDEVEVIIADHVTIEDPNVEDTPVPYAGNLLLQGTTGPEPSGGLASLFMLDTVSGTISYDRADFAYLDDGETVTATFSFDTTSGPDTVAQTITVTITGEQDAPIANDDLVSVPLNTQTSFTVLANDLDPDAGDTLTVISADASIGTVEIETDGTLTYTPPADYVGEAEISYSIEDENGNTDSAVAYLTVFEPDDPPGLRIDFIASMISEAADTSVPTQLVEFTISDDGVSDVNVDLVGQDASMFSIIDNGIYLNAGVTLDHETQQFLQFSIDIADGQTGFTTEPLIFYVNDAPEAEDIDLGLVAADDSRIITEDELLLAFSDTDGPVSEIAGFVIESGAGVLDFDPEGFWTYTPDTGDTSEVVFGIDYTDGLVTVSADATLGITESFEALSDDPSGVSQVDGPTSGLALQQEEQFAFLSADDLYWS